LFVLESLVDQVIDTQHATASVSILTAQ